MPNLRKAGRRSWQLFEWLEKVNFQIDWVEKIWFYVKQHLMIEIQESEHFLREIKKCQKQIYIIIQKTVDENSEISDWLKNYVNIFSASKTAKCSRLFETCHVIDLVKEIKSSYFLIYNFFMKKLIILQEYLKNNL